MTERILTLETKQKIIGIATAPISRQHTVVVGTVTEKQQVTRHLGIGLRTVVEHLHIASIGRSIRRTAAELMIEFIGWDDTHRKTVAFFVQLLDALCLVQPFQRGRYNDHHIYRRIGMMVLVQESIFERRFCKRCCREAGHRLRRIAGQHQIVQTQVLTTCLSDGHRVVARFQVVQTIGPCADGGLGIGIKVCGGTQIVYHRVIYFHGGLKTVVIAQHHRQRSARTIAGQCITLWGTNLIKCLVVEVTTSVIPGKIIHLIERVIVVVRGVVGGCKGRTV